MIGVLQKRGRQPARLPVGIPVISAGHDTQFALFGAGAQPDEPVPFRYMGNSDGTQRTGGHLCSAIMRVPRELDSQVGLYNPGMQWLASGVLEWVRKLFWTAESPRQTLIDEAWSILLAQKASRCTATC